MSAYDILTLIFPYLVIGTFIAFGYACVMMVRSINEGDVKNVHKYTRLIILSEVARDRIMLQTIENRDRIDALKRREEVLSLFRKMPDVKAEFSNLEEEISTSDR